MNIKCLKINGYGKAQHCIPKQLEKIEMSNQILFENLKLYNFEPKTINLITEHDLFFDVAMQHQTDWIKWNENENET
jgi:hypothetical protein